MQDKTAGFVVRDYLSEAIDVDVSNAQWLEVNNLPNTETLCLLDDGEQRFERHYLQLRSAPKLTHLHLSYTPWVVHLDLTDNHDLLTIQGNIEHLDYCYDGGGYLHSASQPLNQVVICPVDRLAQHRDWLENLEPSSLLVVHARRGSAVPKHLHLRTPAQVSLVALKGTEKITFEGMNPAAVMARDCRTLRSIDGESERLRLTECGKNQLHLGGCWHSIELVSCRVERLSIDDAQLLTLRGMVRIKHTHVPDYMQVANHASHYYRTDVFPDINESTLTRLYEVIDSTDGEEQAHAVTNMISALHRCYRPSTRFHGITLLLALARQTSRYDAQIINTAREMTGRNRVKLFSADREVEGWLNYMQLWRLLANRDNPVLNGVFTHADNHHLEHTVPFYALVMTLLENQNEQKLLRKVMLQAVRRQVRDDSGALKLLHKLQRRLLIAVPKFDNATQMACVKFLLTQYRYARMSAKERHQLVQQLLKSIPRVTRRVAMHLANRNPDYQVQYMSVALGAVIPDKKRQA